MKERALLSKKTKEQLALLEEDKQVNSSFVICTMSSRGLSPLQLLDQLEKSAEKSQEEIKLIDKEVVELQKEIELLTKEASQVKPVKGSLKLNF